MKRVCIAAALAGIATVGSATAAADSFTLINTDSTVGGHQAIAALGAPPLPSAGQASVGVQAASSGAGTSAKGESTLEERLATGVAQRKRELAIERAAAERSGTAADAQAIVASAALADQRADAPASSLGEATTLSSRHDNLPGIDVSGSQNPSITPEQSWQLRPGAVREQLLAWGEEDPLWDVLWEKNGDLLSEVDHTFTGSLDEVVVQVAKAFASTGVSIKVLRARANHKLIIRGGN